MQAEIDINGKITKVSISNLSRICQGDSINVSDMAAVSPINTKDLLTNINNRYNENIIFTNVGDTLIITNPYQIIPGLYTEEKMKEIVDYSNENSVDRYERGQPHCFDTTMHSIFDLLHQAKNQALVISGESGAGKTECAKLCMKFIAFYFGKKGEEGKKEENLEDKILACNPVLEAFGNAKTVRNDNSSRFGKYIKIFVKVETNQIVGAYMETYLLEKSRVVSLAPGERNYHIFYQVIAGINELIKVNFEYDKIYKYCEKKRLKLSEPTKKFIETNLTMEKIKKIFNLKVLNEIKYENYNYLKNDVYTVPTIDDIFNFYECLQGMIGTGFKEEEMNNVIKLVVCLLNIGNIEFKQDPKGDSCIIHPDSVAIQKFVCDMMNIDYKIFSEAFLFNVRIIKKETIKSPMNRVQCIAFRDTFSKEIYNRIFGFLVKRMNLTLFDENIRKKVEDDNDIRHIGLLDIFGFECFKENSFEQFCINYANEKLQNLYVEDIFKEIENMFKKENLVEHYSQIEYKDNTIILDAMGKFPSGIFYQLDNECNVAQSDNNLLGRILAQAKKNPSIKSSLKNKDKFFITHTAKEGFCSKNLDEFKLRMRESVDSIKDELLQAMIGNNSGEERHKKEKYLGGKFRSDMDNLAKALGECVRHYIRCLKPNEEKKKNYFVPWFSLLQIKYMGVLDTIRIRQEGYPVKMSYLEWYLKFEDAVDFPGKLFYKNVKEDNPKLKEWCHLIASKLIPTHDENMILFGKTLILMRQTSSDKFENERKKALDSKQKLVTIIANKIRGIESVRSFHSFYGAIYTLEQNYKLFAYINRFNKVREICKILQTKSKMNLIKKENENYIKKLKTLKNFFLSTNIKINSNKNYIQYIQTKYIIKNYVSNFKYKKYLKYKALVKSIIERFVEKHIRSDVTPAAILIQKNIRGYLTKIHMGEFYERIVNRRKILKAEIRVKKIQKHFRKHFYMDKIFKLQKGVDKFVGLIKYHRFHAWYVNTRKNAIIIQRNYKQRFLKIKVIEARLKEFTQDEDIKYEDSTFVNSVTLFPERQIESKPDEKGSQATLRKIENLQKFYDKKIQSLNPTQITEVKYLNHSRYDEPKLHFFAHILDLDAIINTDDIYVSVPWSETFQTIINHNIKQNTPIQLIEVGEFHTTLVNSLGKTFTWGWDANGQCAFNMNKDKYFLFNGFKKDKKINGNNFDLNDINFDKEIENIKNEKEIFENGNNDDEEEKEDENENESSKERKIFNEDSFTDFYYLDSPILIDNFNVRKIECGQDNTMILTKENKLYVFGSNNHFQFGNINNKNIYSPTSFQNIIKAQQGDTFVNIQSDIKVMKFSGKNALLLNQAGNLILLSCFVAGVPHNEALYSTPIEIYTPDVKFSHIECGKDFCLLLSTFGLLYSFGTNQFGQLGHGDTIQRTYPALVKFFLDKKKKVDQISCGFKHSACKFNNKIYTWGCNSNGQLGTGDLKHMYTPNLVDIKYSKIQFNFLQVSCGFRATAFLTETRKLYWCGTCGDIQQQLEPIEFMYSIKIPELFYFDNHVIVKINHTWSKTMSILYATVAEIGPLKRKLNNPNKLNKILNNLTNKWIYKDIYPPRGEDLDKYIAGKHLIKEIKASNIKKSKP